MEQKKVSGKFLIQKIFDKIFEKGNVSLEDQQTINSALEKEILERPFRVAVIGQSGVGKSQHLMLYLAYPTTRLILQRAQLKLLRKYFL